MCFMTERMSALLINTVSDATKVVSQPQNLHDVIKCSMKTVMQVLIINPQQNLLSITDKMSNVMTSRLSF